MSEPRTLPIPPADLELHVREQLGRYPITGRLGEGAMGAVLRVRDTALDREVAAKVALSMSPEQLEKFEQEARVTGQLEHPNIVPVYELSRTAEGARFFTMKQVRGQTLEAVLAAGRSSLSQLLQIFLKVCDAVAFAHSRGVIHRDLKPANIMVGEFGEVQVMDWGLAKVTDPGVRGEAAVTVRPPRSGPLQTLDGTVLGTPAYMPPEQAAGQTAQLDRRSDVYALGAILYRMLTGLPPYDGEGAWEVVQAVRSGPPPAPSLRAPDRKIPWELEAVVIKAMADRRAQRYQQVPHLAAEIQRFLDGAALRAVRYSPAQRAGKWLRRHRVALSIVGAAALVLALVVGWRRARASASRYQAQSEARSLQLAAAERYRHAMRLTAPVRRKIDECRPFFYIPEIALLQRKLRDVEQAVTRLEALVRQPGYDRFAEVWTAIGMGDYFLGRLPSAEHALLRAHRLDPTNGWARFYLARIYAERGVAALGAHGYEVDRALSESRRWSRLSLRFLEGELRGVDPVGRDLAGALAALGQGDRARVSRLCDEGLERHANQLGVENFHVFKALALIDHDLLRKLATTPRSRLPPAEGALLLSMALAQQQALTRALALRRHFPGARVARAALYQHLEQWSQAEQEYTHALTVYPHLAKVRQARAYARYKLGKFTGARDDLLRVLSGSPGPQVAHKLLGVALLELGQTREALTRLNRALALAPDDLNALTHRARALVVRGQYAAARRDLQRVLAARPSDVDGLNVTGLLLAREQRYRDAARFFSRVIQLAPRNLYAHHNRGLAFYNLGRHAEAVRDLRTAISLGKKGWKIWFVLGLALKRLGQSRAAVQALNQALELAPASEKARIGRAIPR